LVEDLRAAIRSPAKFRPPSPPTCISPPVSPGEIGPVCRRRPARDGTDVIAISLVIPLTPNASRFSRSALLRIRVDLGGPSEKAICEPSGDQETQSTPPFHIIVICSASPPPTVIRQTLLWAVPWREKMRSLAVRAPGWFVSDFIRPRVSLNRTGAAFSLRQT